MVACCHCGCLWSHCIKLRRKGCVTTVAEFVSNGWGQACKVFYSIRGNIAKKFDLTGGAYEAQGAEQNRIQVRRHCPPQCARRRGQAPAPEWCECVSACASLMHHWTVATYTHIPNVLYRTTRNHCEKIWACVTRVLRQQDNTNEPGSKLQNALLFAASKLRQHFGTKPVLDCRRFDKFLRPNVCCPVPSCAAAWRHRNWMRREAAQHQCQCQEKLSRRAPWGASGCGLDKVKEMCAGRAI